MDMGTVFHSEKPSLVFSGLSTAAQATNDALDRGMSQKQAFWNGLSAGIFEGVFEKWSIGNFRGLKEVASTHAKDIAKNIAKSMLVNASEETLTEIANIAYDSIVNGDFSQYETKVRQYVLNGMTATEAKKKAALELGSQVVEAGASGALMCFGFGAMGSAPAVVRNAFNQVKSNQALKGQEYGHLKDTALQTIDETLDPENTQTKKLTAYPNSSNHLPSGASQALRTLAEESATADSGVSKNTTDSGMRYTPKKSSDHQASANSDRINPSAPVNPEEVTKSLMSKGIPSKKANILAEAITATLTGQELTNTQRNLLKSEITRTTVQNVISDTMKKLRNRIDSTQNRMYDSEDISDALSGKEKNALWDLSHQHIGAFSNHDYAAATEVATVDQSNASSSKGVFDSGLDDSIKKIDQFIEGSISFDDVLDDYAKVYADKINSNQLWSWEDTIPGGENLTPRQRSIIKRQAVDAGIIPDIRVTKVEGMRYGFADFEAAEVVIKTQYLPEHMWKMSDAEQFTWLNEQSGETVKGYTWHHTETPGKMQLVPTGIHNITTHNGGRTAGMWADFPR